jgi:hypothetical protein
MIYQTNGPPNHAEVGIPILDKVNFKLKLVKRDKEGHFILIKGEIHQDERTISTLCTPKVTAPN